MTYTVEERMEKRQLYLEGCEVIEYPEINAVVGLSLTATDKPSAVGFSGTRGKPDFNYFFKNTEERDKYIQKWLQSIKDDIESKQKRREKKKRPKGVMHDFKPGDIIYNSWGYDQTNIDFYQITRVTDASIFIRAIASKIAGEKTGAMCAYVKPDRDNYIGPEQRKAIQWNDGQAYITFKYGGYSKWEEGDLVYQSWYA